MAYLDNAATTQRPESVIRAIDGFYRNENANTHRGVYDLANQASLKYEDTRAKVADLLGTKADNIAFTSGSTESLNIVARSYLASQLEKGDNVVVSILEHHSNFVPWQQIAKEKGAEFRVVPILTNGELDLIELGKLLDGKTKMLAITHVSNTIGTVNDIDKIVEMAHQKSIPVTVDAAQSAAFYELDQKQLGYDFLAFSGHKIFGPFGIGVLFVSDEFQDQVGPSKLGGGMIQEVSISETFFAEFPKNMEAGTPNIAGVIGLGAAIDFFGTLDRQEENTRILELGWYCKEQLRSIQGVEIVGSDSDQTSIVSFTVKDIHPHDVASFLNKDGIAVRAGMHCTQPLLEFLQTPSTVRVSFSIYNSKEEVDRLKHSVLDLIKFWS